MKPLKGWPTLLSKFNQIISYPSSIIGTISSTDTTSNELSQETLSGSNEGYSLNRHLSVLEKLTSCKGAMATLINMQLAVISLHRLLNQVSHQI